MQADSLTWQKALFDGIGPAAFGAAVAFGVARATVVWTQRGDRRVEAHRVSLAAAESLQRVLIEASLGLINGNNEDYFRWVSEGSVQHPVIDDQDVIDRCLDLTALVEAYHRMFVAERDQDLPSEVREAAREQSERGGALFPGALVALLDAISDYRKGLHLAEWSGEYRRYADDNAPG